MRFGIFAIGICVVGLYLLFRRRSLPVFVVTVCAGAGGALSLWMGGAF